MSAVATSHADIDAAVAALMRYLTANPERHGVMTRLYRDASGEWQKNVVTNVGQPVTRELVKAHLEGNAGIVKHGLGYLAGTEEGTNVGCLDLDRKNYAGDNPDTDPDTPDTLTLEDARQRILDVCRALGLHIYCEESVRGGWHLWIFFTGLLPWVSVTKALREILRRAGLSLGTNETYPKGDDHKSAWTNMPYYGAATSRDGLGRTFLQTADGEAIRFNELEEWLELSDAATIAALAASYVEDAAGSSESTAVDLSPEGLDLLIDAIRSPDLEKLTARHAALAAIINVAARMGRKADAVAALLDEKMGIRKAWIKDGSRDAKKWAAEVTRWAKEDKSDRRRGIKFLLEMGFKIGTLPKNTTTAEPDLLEFLRTDYGNAERLVALHGGSIRHCAALGWLLWDGTRWKADEGPGITRKALETARTLFAQAATVPDSDRRADWVKHSLACEKRGALENAITLAKSIPGVSININDFDRDPMLLNVLNGTLDLRTGLLRPHRREDLITKLAPVTYDPAATCPQWLAFQGTIAAGDQELVDFKQRAYGYSLTGDTREHVLFIAYGGGANGKGTEAETIREVLGEYAQSTPFDTFTIRSSDTIRNDIARLVGSRLVSASEGDAGKRLAESLVKQLTGGDTVAARFLHQEFFEFRPQFKLWLATNHKPVIRGTDKGIWRRIRLLPYNVTIPDEQQDGQLPVKLRGEHSGVLNWLLEGCLAWQRIGLKNAGAVKDATASYREESDVLSGFLSNCCVIDELHSVPAKQLYEAYTAWCTETGDEAFTSTMFGRLLNERGFIAKKTGGKVYRHGISITVADEGEEGEQDS